jgi:DNA-binding XRE family transcriptional regulator
MPNIIIKNMDFLSKKDLTKFAQTNVKVIRKLTGMTQDEFAKSLEIKRSLLGAIEEGRTLSIMTMYKIASTYDLTIDSLITQII